MIINMFYGFRISSSGAHSLFPQPVKNGIFIFLFILWQLSCDHLNYVLELFSGIFILQVQHIFTNGSLHFPPFAAEEFRQDVHWAIYRCTASNTVGTIISRDVIVKAGKWYQLHLMPLKCHYSHWMFNKFEDNNLC